MGSGRLSLQQWRQTCRAAVVVAAVVAHPQPWPRRLFLEPGLEQSQAEWEFASQFWDPLEPALSAALLPVAAPRLPRERRIARVKGAEQSIASRAAPP